MSVLLACPVPQVPPASSCALSVTPAVTEGHSGGDFKYCGSCHSWLPLARFGQDHSQPSGHAKACRDCRAREYKRNRTQCRLRDAKNHQMRRAEHYRSRYEALIAALPDWVLGRLPADIRPTAMQLRVHRAAHRKRAVGLPVTY